MPSHICDHKHDFFFLSKAVQDPLLWFDPEKIGLSIKPLSIVVMVVFYVKPVQIIQKKLLRERKKDILTSM